MKSVRELVVDKFEVAKVRGVRYVCYGCEAVYNEDAGKYEMIPADGQYVLSSTASANRTMLRLCTVKNGKLVMYAFITANDTFNDYGDNRYLLGYAFAMTRHNRKVDSVCIQDLLELAEQLTK